MQAQVAVIAYWFTIALLAGATVLYAYHVTTKKKQLARVATVLTGLGFLTLTASVGMRSSATDGTDLTGANSLVLMAWALVLVYFVMEYLIKVKVYGTVLVPVALVLLLVAQLQGVLEIVPANQNALLESWSVGIHVFLIVLGSAGFLICGVASLTYLIVTGGLKKKRSSKLFKRLPSLAQTDLIARRSAQWAFPVYTAALLLGIMRAIETAEQIGHAWWADIVVMLAGIVWALFGAYLFLRSVRGWGGKGPAYLAITGATLVVVLRIVSQVVGGAGRFHIFGL